MYLRGKAQVARDSAVLVGDTITFNDSTQIVEARGDTVLLRDPSRGPDDVVGRQRLRYDVRNREGTVRDVSTAIESGERWIVHGGVAAFKGDTTDRRPVHVLRQERDASRAARIRRRIFTSRRPRSR